MKKLPILIGCGVLSKRSKTLWTIVEVITKRGLGYTPSGRVILMETSTPKGNIVTRTLKKESLWKYYTPDTT